MDNRIPRLQTDAVDESELPDHCRSLGVHPGKISNTFFARWVPDSRCHSV